ncbi:MAG: hypothetical protein A2X34_03030 [Elusimicrobia bacterium GWC2_51_8]|nr:MAG: hypothetical protein A2X33_03995 [Elusimicrobia bacterium GWA2_51_34]OGR60663.1 MAG: hypothetical protein A2X34_03030 [Elusimicrobia bacterium GWC2_51_8]OGR84474.1 MAG: hypothetical protein A2021_01785 [Elusimicrobia bacterium GWF2_52_66]
MLNIFNHKDILQKKPRAPVKYNTNVPHWCGEISTADKMIKYDTQADTGGRLPAGFVFIKLNAQAGF